MSTSSLVNNYYSHSLYQPLEDGEGREEQVLKVVWGYFQPKGRTLNSHFENVVKGLGTPPRCLSCSSSGKREVFTWYSLSAAAVCAGVVWADP